MARTRVHELAKEWGTESTLVLNRLMEVGVFARSASSTLSPFDEQQIRNEVLKADSQGIPIPFWFQMAIGKPPWRTREERAQWEQDKSKQRSRYHRAREPKKTSWTDSPLGPDAERIWRINGLGDDNEPLARWLLEHGFWPEDLRIHLRGTPAVTRFRSGEASWAVVANELREVRDSTPPTPRLPPPPAVIRRQKSA